MLTQAADLSCPAPVQAAEAQTCPPCPLRSRDPAQRHPSDVPGRTTAGRVEPGLGGYQAGSALGGEARETGTERGERTAGDFQGRNFFAMGVMEHWNRLPREMVDAPTLEIFKVRLDEALRNLL